MGNEKETEIVEDIASDRVLDLAREALRKDKKKLRISKICSIVVPILIGILLIGYPIITHNINADRNERYWKQMISQAEISYNELEKEESDSIEEINDKKKGRFYWIDNATVTGTYILKQDEKIIVIEEHYLYEDIECVLYVTNRESSIVELNKQNITLNGLSTFKDYFLIKYGIFEGSIYGNFNSIYKYQFIINSTDTSTIEAIFSNLTNN
ncbi:MAG: hypothetical protein K2K48_02820 [Anaeroplasmataceae bacterium]|nr:hypothetical protein [Anaeroplasmataceae bacterium]